MRFFFISGVIPVSYIVCRRPASVNTYSLTGAAWIGGMGLETKEVIVEEYNSDWEDEFRRIEAFLDGKLHGKVLAIEHVGSTSVRGLAAKPVIDIDVVIEDAPRFDEVKSLLLLLDYVHEGDLGICGRESFRYKGEEDMMKHHLYVCTKDSSELRRHIIFREHLREDKDDREAYGCIKKQAARLFPRDIDGYMETKAQIIKEIYRKLGLLD